MKDKNLRIIVWKYMILACIMMTLTACGERNDAGNRGITDAGTTVSEVTVLQTQAAKKATYMQITAKEAKEIMDTEEGYVILDVRAKSEYDEKHIPGAIVIPDTEIEEKAEGILTDKDQLILVYCRSGRRSKNASAALAKLGYTNVKEFGGINDWPYEVE